jgi:thiaminase/transcriptional activator TenA
MIFETMRKAVTPLLNKIHQHAFNIELAEGTLPQEKFIFYLIQDALYLADFSRALAITATKMQDNQLMQQFFEFAQGALTAERQLHLDYLKTHHTLPYKAEPSPACFMYTNFLLKIANSASVEESVASLLPCFWIYHEVGKKIAKTHQALNHPYATWITTYASMEFEQSVNKAIASLNTLGKLTSIHNQQKMLSAFIRSSQLEWMFWESAYHLEKWPV